MRKRSLCIVRVHPTNAALKRQRVKPASAEGRNSSSLRWRCASPVKPVWARPVSVRHTCPQWPPVRIPFSPPKSWDVLSRRPATPRG